VRNLSLIARPLNPGWARRLALGVALAGVLAGVVTTGLTLAGVEPFADSRQVTGIGVNSQYVPEGALRYLDRIGVTGKIFNTFHWGGYVAWRDFPRRAPIIDGRGYVPPGLLEEIYFARFYPRELERLQATYGFDVAVVDYPVYTDDTIEEAKPGADFALPSPQWALVYWDDVALVYLRRTERFAAIIARDQYRHVKPANGALFLSRMLSDRSAFAAIDAEIRRNIAETQSSIGYALQGFAAFEIGAYDAAVAAFNHVRYGPMLHEAYQGLALAHWRKGNMAQAIEYYRKLVRVNEDPIWLYDIGLAFLETGNYREAIDYLERARRKAPQFAPVYPTLIDAYRRTGTAAGREPELAVAYANAVTLGRAEEHARRALQLYREGRSAEAIAELRASLQLNPRNAKAASTLGVIYFNLGQFDDALVQQKTALTLDANFANAHYGLAMIYQRRGDHAAARRHFEEFVRLEPRSYFAWRVRADLRQLAR
jgi:tetratricopeptide (TPR) repeat protein